MATTTTSTLSELVFPGLKGIFGDQYDTWQAEYTQFMDIVPSGKSFEDYQELTGWATAKSLISILGWKLKRTGLTRWNSLVDNTELAGAIA